MKEFSLCPILLHKLSILYQNNHIVETFYNYCIIEEDKAMDMTNTFSRM